MRAPDSLYADALSDLSAEERTLALHSESLWREASRRVVQTSTSATSITSSAISSSHPPSGSVVDSLVDDFALTHAERALFAALEARSVRFMLLGLAAALLEGAPVATQDLDVWFENTSDDRVRDAARDAGGFWISGFGMQPPAFGGAGLERIDVVLTAHGLDDFSAEYERAAKHIVDGLTLRVLPLRDPSRTSSRPEERRLH